MGQLDNSKCLINLVRHCMGNKGNLAEIERQEVLFYQESCPCLSRTMVIRRRERGNMKYDQKDPPTNWTHEFNGKRSNILIVTSI